jgi:hypothetical protein
MTDLHPDTGEPTQIVVGRIDPLIARDMRIGGRAAAHGRGRAIIDMAMAKDIAARRRGPAAEAAIGAALMKLLDDGTITLDQMRGASQAMREILHMADGVIDGKPNALAVNAATRIASPAGLIEMASRPDLGEVVMLAYAVLQLDEERALDGGAL